jgi:hypothetical protein
VCCGDRAKHGTFDVRGSVEVTSLPPQTWLRKVFCLCELPPYHGCVNLRTLMLDPDETL